MVVWGQEFPMVPLVDRQSQIRCQLPLIFSENVTKVFDQREVKFCEARYQISLISKNKNANLITLEKLVWESVLFGPFDFKGQSTNSEQDD